jgi:hypothetical protein
MGCNFTNAVPVSCDLDEYEIADGQFKSIANCKRALA